MYFHRRGAAANYGTDTISGARIRFQVMDGPGKSARISMTFEGSFDKRSTHKYTLDLEPADVQKLIQAMANTKSSQSREALSETLSGSTRELVRLTAMSAGTLGSD